MCRRTSLNLAWAFRKLSRFHKLQGNGVVSLGDIGPATVLIRGFASQGFVLMKGAARFAGVWGRRRKGKKKENVGLASCFPA